MLVIIVPGHPFPDPEIFLSKGNPIPILLDVS
jgi:hypothetical protein